MGASGIAKLRRIKENRERKRSKQQTRENVNKDGLSAANSALGSDSSLAGV